MRINSVSAIPFVLPYLKPFHMANGVVTAAEHVLIRVETDDGLTGVAEAVSRPMIYGESQSSIVAAVNSWLGPAIIGLDPFATETAQTLQRSVVANETAKGAIDIALHDIHGKALNVSTWRLLGAASTTLQVTHMLGMGDATEVITEATTAKAQFGVDSFKVKVDADLGAGIELVAALRRELGDSANLYIDANQSLNAEAVLRSLPRLEELGIDLLEEPIAETDLIGRARIAAISGAPIMCDESARTVESAAAQLTAGSARAISIKPARTGYTESARILGLARGLHARTVIGSQGDSALGTITSATFGAAFESTMREPAELDYFLGLADHIVTNVPKISDGLIHIEPAAVGNGVEIDEQKLARYRVDL